MKLQKKWLNNILIASTLMIVSNAMAAVVTSIRPLGFIASAITDGITSTEVLLPDGASPHDFALRPSDIQRLRGAELVLWVGPEMEVFLSKSLSQVPANNILTISEIAGVKPLLIKGGDDHNNGSDDHTNDEYDMHVWLSPEVAKVTAITIHDKLLEVMPQNKDKLDENLRQFEILLAETDYGLTKVLKPLQGQEYFVFHDAYGYFEKHYGLNPLGYFTVNPQIQPGAQRLHQIRTQLVEHKVVCVLTEPQFRPDIINAVTKGTQVRSGTLDPLGIGIALGKNSYKNFLTALSNQYISCLK